MAGDEARLGDFRVVCDLSGFKCWASDTILQWNGLRVLRRFADERNPQDFPARISENTAVRDPRPERQDVYQDGPVLPGDL